MNRQLHFFMLLFAATGLLLNITLAEAYIGPGAGLSLLGALWALIVAVVAAVGFMVLWPIRRLRKRRLAQQRARTVATQPPPVDVALAHDTAPQDGEQNASSANSLTQRS